MTNIFNKRVLVENGTLINNWYEEEVLKKLTGETRSIPGVHIKKKHFGPEFEIQNDNLKHDDTKLRTMGVERIVPYSTTNQFYGDFTSEEHKFNKVGIKEKIFKDFFTSYLTNEKSLKEQHNSEVKSARLNESTYKSSFIKQPNITKVGSRHMQTLDGIPIDQSKIDKFFMASHDMSKYQRVIPDDKVHEYINKTIPFVDDKAITFWSQNMNKSNVYHSHMKGENQFARSSGFTQPLNSTKSGQQYYGNVGNDNTSKNVFIHKDSPNYSQFIETMKNRVVDLSDSIRQKFLNTMFNKG